MAAVFDYSRSLRSHARAYKLAAEQKNFVVVEFTRSLKEIYGNYSATCADNIENGFIEMKKLMSTPEGRIELDKAFLFAPPLVSQDQTPTHQQNAFHVVIGHFLIAAQFSQVHKVGGRQHSSGAQAARKAAARNAKRLLHVNCDARAFARF